MTLLMRDQENIEKGRLEGKLIHIEICRKNCIVKIYVIYLIKMKRKKTKEHLP